MKKYVVMHIVESIDIPKHEMYCPMPVTVTDTFPEAENECKRLNGIYVEDDKRKGCIILRSYDTGSLHMTAEGKYISRWFTVSEVNYNPGEFGRENKNGKDE